MIARFDFQFWDKEYTETLPQSLGEKNGEGACEVLKNVIHFVRQIMTSYESQRFVRRCIFGMKIP